MVVSGGGHGNKNSERIMKYCLDTSTIVPIHDVQNIVE